MTVERLPMPRHSKEELWQLACWFAGVLAVLFFLYVFTFGALNPFGLMGRWQWIVIATLLIGLSQRSPRLWNDFNLPQTDDPPTVPAINISGPPSSTFVVLDDPRRRRRLVRPGYLDSRDWTLYSLLVRGPLELGNLVLTGFWRLTPWGRRVAAGPPAPAEDF